MPSSAEAARGRWREILPAFGVDAKYLRNSHGPCPICEGGKDRFRFDDKDGNGTWWCNACGNGDGLELLRRVKGLSFAEAAKQVDEITGRTSDPRQGRERRREASSARHRIERLASSSQPALAGINPVTRYLKSRGLFATPATRYCPRVRYYEDGKPCGVYPAMVHSVRSPGGAVLSLHVTYLTQDGRKADVRCPKKLLPASGPLAGAAIRLMEPGPVMGIAEGVETAMAAHALFRFPVWAAVNSTLMEKVQWPDVVKTLFVYADNDLNYAGQKAAFTLAHRAACKGVDVIVAMPPGIGDWADELERSAG